MLSAMPQAHKVLIDVVARSPALVALHDREGWLALFSDDARVEDPLGSPPAPKASGQLASFWDTFIGPHEIRFEVRRDHVRGNDVVRDVVIHTRIGEHVRIAVPAYLLYQLDDGGGELRVLRMAAHWELARLSLGALKLGPRAWVALTVMFARMLRRMGLRWVGGYLAALWRGVGRRGVDAVNALPAALAARDAAALGALFDDDATVELGGTRAAGRQLLTLVPPGSALTVAAPVAAGWSVAFRFTLSGAEPRAGVALFDFDPGSRRVRRARFFDET
jgi:ketosteroid isomerase-like protein